MQTYLQPTIIVLLFVFAFIADHFLPGTASNVAKADITPGMLLGGGAVLAIIGGWIYAIRGNGTSDPICKADDPEKFKKISDYSSRNNDRN